MSQSATIMTDANFKRDKSPFPVKINTEIAQEIDSIATRQQMRVEVLINEVLSQFVLSQSDTTKQSGAAFLLSIAGVFDSGTTDTSENVRDIVRDFILQKHS